MSHPESFDRTKQDDADLFEDDVTEVATQLLGAPSTSTGNVDFLGVDTRNWEAVSTGMPGTLEHSYYQDQPMYTAYPFRGELIQGGTSAVSIAEETAHWAGRDSRHFQEAGSVDTSESRTNSDLPNGPVPMDEVLDGPDKHQRTDYVECWSSNDLPHGPAAPMNELPDGPDKRLRADDIVSIWQMSPKASISQSGFSDLSQETTPTIPSLC